MINSILVATDSSPSSKRALEAAIDLALKYETSLHIVQVIHDMQMPEEIRTMAEIASTEGEETDVLTTVAERILNEAKLEAEKVGVREVQISVGQGDPATIIVDTAHQLAVDLVVLGTRGLSQVKSLLLGSVSQKVSNLADVNCLIVR